MREKKAEKDAEGRFARGNEEGVQGASSEYPTLAEWLFIPEDVADIDADVPDVETPEEAWPWLVKATIDISLPLACVLGVSRTKWRTEDSICVMIDEAVVDSMDVTGVSEALEWFYKALFGMSVQVEARKVSFEDFDEEEKTAWSKAVDFEGAKERFKQSLLNHPIVQEAIEIFDPEIVSLRVKLYDEAIKGL